MLAKCLLNKQIHIVVFWKMTQKELDQALLLNTLHFYLNYSIHQTIYKVRILTSQ